MRLGLPKILYGTQTSLAKRANVYTSVFHDLTTKFCIRISAFDILVTLKSLFNQKRLWFQFKRNF